MQLKLIGFGMIVRITNRSNRHYGHYGIVYKLATDHGLHQILILKDGQGNLCVKAGFAHTPDFEGIPEEEERKFDAFPFPLQDTSMHVTATDLNSLIEDGRKFRKLQELLK